MEMLGGGDADMCTWMRKAIPHVKNEILKLCKSEGKV